MKRKKRSDILDLFRLRLGFWFFCIKINSIVWLSLHVCITILNINSIIIYYAHSSVLFCRHFSEKTCLINY